MNLNKTIKILEKNQIHGLGPLEVEAYKKIVMDFTKGKELTFVNIICPGYKKKREAGVEEFDFAQLSEEVFECPNVILMIEKMNRLCEQFKMLGKENIKIKTILADVAILNFKEMTKRQNIKNVMDRFLKSIKKSGFVDTKTTVLLKMSELPYEFRKIPLGGLKPSTANRLFADVKKDIKLKADEYAGSLVFGRVNKLMSEGKTFRKGEATKQSRIEVKRFMAEYGLAGLAIKKMYKNPIICFTEPSGYMRGYFYNSFLNKKDRLPVLYLC